MRTRNISNGGKKRFPSEITHCEEASTISWRFNRYRLKKYSQRVLILINKYEPQPALSPYLFSFAEKLFSNPTDYQNSDLISENVNGCLLFKYLETRGYWHLLIVRDLKAPVKVLRTFQLFIEIIKWMN